MCARTHAHSHTMRSPWYQIIYFFRFRIFLSFHSVPWLSQTQFFLIDDRKGHTERISCIRAYEAHEKISEPLRLCFFIGARCCIPYILTLNGIVSARERQNTTNSYEYHDEYTCLYVISYSSIVAIIISRIITSFAVDRWPFL